MPINNAPPSVAMSSRSISVPTADHLDARALELTAAAKKAQNRRSLPHANREEVLPWGPLPSYIPPLSEDQKTGLLGGYGRSLDRTMAALSISPPHSTLPHPALEELRLVFPNWPEGRGCVSLDPAAALRLSRTTGWSNVQIKLFLQWCFTQGPVDVQLTPAGAAKLYDELVRAGNQTGLKYVLFARQEKYLTQKAVMSALERRINSKINAWPIGVARAQAPLWKPYLLGRIDPPQGAKLVLLEQDTHHHLPNDVPLLRAYFGEPRALRPIKLLQPTEETTSKDAVDSDGYAHSLKLLYVDTDQGQMLVNRGVIQEWGRLKIEAGPATAKGPTTLATTWKSFTTRRDELLTPPPELNLFRTLDGHLLKMTIIVMTDFEKEVESWKIRAPSDFGNGTRFNMI